MLPRTPATGGSIDRDDVLAAVGALLLAIGAYWPWIQPNPQLEGERDAIPSILLPEMNAGIEASSLVLLALAGIAIATAVGHGRPRARAAAVATTGALTLLAAAYYLHSQSLVGFDGTFVPTLGWYATVLASVVLLGAGVDRWVRAERRQSPVRPAQSSRRDADDAPDDDSTQPDDPDT